MDTLKICATCLFWPYPHHIEPCKECNDGHPANTMKNWKSKESVEPGEISVTLKVAVHASIIVED